MKVGIIGAGGIARAHGNCLKMGLPDIDFVGVSDINEEASKKYAEELGVKAFASVEDMLASDIDAVIVCTVPLAHEQNTIDALAAGKHVFCEKPLTVTLDSAKRMKDAVKASDKKFQIGYIFHHSMGAQKVKQMIDSGEMGDLSVAWSQRYGYFVPSTDTWFGHQDQGGGILDFCTHDIEFLVWWGGRPKSVIAQGVKAHASTNCIDTVSATFEFKQGMGVVVSSWCAPCPMMNIGAAGTKAGVTFQQDGSLSIKYQDKDEPEIIKPEVENPQAATMVAEQRHFFDSIANNTEPTPGIDDAILALEVEEAVRESWRTGGRVML